MVFFNRLFGLSRKKGIILRKDNKTAKIFGGMPKYSYLCSRISENPEHLMT